jgi:hypothetical protein
MDAGVPDTILQDFVSSVKYSSLVAEILRDAKDASAAIRAINVQTEVCAVVGDQGFVRTTNMLP